MRTIISRFGVHWEGEFAFLHEKGVSACLNNGFEGVRSPFELATHPLVQCPHTFLSGAEPSERPISRMWNASLLAQAMLPDAAGGAAVYWAHANERRSIEELTQLSSLSHAPLFALWSARLPEIKRALEITNIGPVVIVGYDVTHYPLMRAILALPRSRPIIFCGDFPPPGPSEFCAMLPSALALNLSRLPLRDIGWSILKKQVAKLARKRGRRK